VAASPRAELCVPRQDEASSAKEEEQQTHLSDVQLVDQVAVADARATAHGARGVAGALRATTEIESNLCCGEEQQLLRRLNCLHKPLIKFTHAPR
jgi:hypothetical protein